DLFLTWWIVSLSIGLGVLYMKRSGPIATTPLGIYVVIALTIALIRTVLAGGYMSRKNILIIAGFVVVLAAVVGANLYFKKDTGLPVTTDVIKTRDLEAIVSASGKIQPKRLVNISADTPGRVVNLAVNEGDRVHIG